MNAAELLAEARQVLRTRNAALSSRMAAFLARQALEEIIDERCTALGASAPSATTRSKLLILRVLGVAGEADRAGWRGTG